MQNVRLALFLLLVIDEPPRAVRGLGRVLLCIARAGREQDLDLDLAGALPVWKSNGAHAIDAMLFP